MRSWLAVMLLGALGLGIGYSAFCTLPVAGADDKPKTVKKPTTKKKPIANTESLDTKVSQAEAAYIRETESLASEFYDAGHYDKAEVLLKKIDAVEPGRPGVKEKLKAIEDTKLTSNEGTFDLDPGAGWQPAKVMLFKDEAIRIQVDGTYRFNVNTVLTPEGFPADRDNDAGMVPGMRCGAVVGVIVADGNGQGNRKQKVPFLIGKGLESFNPPATGMLFLRVNAPQEAKSTGKLKITISGSVKAL